MSFSIAHSPSIVKLNIGGQKFCTTVDTLTLREPNSMLAAMFSGRHDVNCQRSEKGYIFIDRDGNHFRHILNWLRDGALPILKYRDAMELLREAEYFQLVGLIDEIKSRKFGLAVDCNATSVYSDLTRSDIIKWAQSLHKKVSLRLQGVILPGIDLSGLDLSGITLTGANLKGANLKGTNLTGAKLENVILTGANITEATLKDANLINANMEKADLAQSNLGNAHLNGANLSSANMEKANLHGANFCKTNLNHANLKGANLQGVAICNDTDLRNANLEDANLVEAFIEFGCSMKDANLARANLHGAAIIVENLRGVGLKGPKLRNLEEVALNYGITVTGASFANANIYCA